MSPAILIARGGPPTLAIGASGGARIPGAILQVIHRALAGGASLDEAIGAPRFHAPGAGGLQIEQGLGALAPDLRARGEVVEDPKPSFSAVTALRLRRDATNAVFEAAADARKEGSAKIWRTTPAKETAPPTGR